MLIAVSHRQQWGCNCRREETNQDKQYCSPMLRPSPPAVKEASELPEMDMQLTFLRIGLMHYHYSSRVHANSRGDSDVALRDRVEIG